MMTPEQEQALEEFLQELPEDTQRIARIYPPTICYKSKQSPRYHYMILSYSDKPEGPDGAVTVTLIHGADSSLPGVATFGQEPEQLIVCDCGKWEPPT